MSGREKIRERFIISLTESTEIKSYKKAYMRVLRQPNELCLAYYKGRLISLVVFGYVANGRFSPVSDIGLIRLEEFKQRSLIIHKKPNEYIEILNG